MDPVLQVIKRKLAEKEDIILSSHAEKSSTGIRRHLENREGHRPAFAVDADRILHSRAYTRYIDKTQVFYMIKNDHITHRVLHVQLVSKIARTIGRVLGLNEDLIEAIALGHDIGHPPFGHDGEKMLHDLCLEHGMPSFQHNLQSIRFLEFIEKKGKGINLTVQVLDGILCHDGEIHNRILKPSGDRSFTVFDEKCEQKYKNAETSLVPMTLEACVVRFCDTVSYIGRDIEDAIELRLIKRDDIPELCQEKLGKSNGTIVHNLVTDLLENSKDGTVAFSKEVSDALLELKAFNYEYIYLNPEIKKHVERIKGCYQTLFSRYLDDVDGKGRGKTVFSEFVGKMDDNYRNSWSPVVMACDFIAGMTDDYFLNQAREFGCNVPVKS
ncbi:MAG: HD domain-containing protein [Desulfobulbaceae bacterium]|uniref:HD domain-containing protein n=1 Tax=Candidatus Desulfobia pelagia TaxID=2841692 RepID=A0A8J6TFW7_9BACT|nr:HD domain-containing protein [Candidatus Desulfobia pelagia]